MQIHSFKQYYDVRTLGKTSKQITFPCHSNSITDEQTRFLSTAFLPSEFKLYTLEKIFEGKILAVIFWRELIFANHWKNRKN